MTYTVVAVVTIICIIIIGLVTFFVYIRVDRYNIITLHYNARRIITLQVPRLQTTTRYMVYNINNLYDSDTL